MTNQVSVRQINQFLPVIEACYNGSNFGIEVKLHSQIRLVASPNLLGTGSDSVGSFAERKREKVIKRNIPKRCFGQCFGGEGARIIAVLYKERCIVGVIHPKIEAIHDTGQNIDIQKVLIHDAEGGAAVRIDTLFLEGIR